LRFASTRYRPVERRHQRSAAVFHQPNDDGALAARALGLLPVFAMLFATYGDYSDLTKLSSWRRRFTVPVRPGCRLRPRRPLQPLAPPRSVARMHRTSMSTAMTVCPVPSRTLCSSTGARSFPCAQTLPPRPPGSATAIFC
jgi:hypothetical protein